MQRRWQRRPFDQLEFVDKVNRMRGTRGEKSRTSARSRSDSSGIYHIFTCEPEGEIILAGEAECPKYPTDRPDVILQVMSLMDGLQAKIVPNLSAPSHFKFSPCSVAPSGFFLCLFYFTSSERGGTYITSPRMLRL